MHMLSNELENQAYAHGDYGEAMHVCAFMSVLVKNDDCFKLMHGVFVCDGMNKVYALARQCMYNT